MAKTRGEINQKADAGARYLRISSSKLNQVAALIRNTPVDEARRILAFTPKSASYELSKVLEAAIANAEHNHDLHADELFVKEVRTDEGPTLKRFRPRALGRAYRIRKRTSHIHITVERRVSETSTRQAARPASQQAAARRWRRQQADGTEAGSETAARTKTPRTRRRLRRDSGDQKPGRGSRRDQAGRAQNTGRSGKGGDRRGS